MKHSVFSLKHKLYKEHVASCAADYAEESVSAPDVEKNNNRNSHKLRDPVRRVDERSVLQAIDYQHTHYGVREVLAKPKYVFGSFSFATGQNKGEKT